MVRKGVDRAVSAGPGLLHVYTTGSGAWVYRAPARSRGDADCVAVHAEHAVTGRAPAVLKLEPRREVGLTLAGEEVACVSATSPAGELELYFHVHSEVQVLSPPLAAAARRFAQ